MPCSQAPWLHIKTPGQHLPCSSSQQASLRHRQGTVLNPKEPNPLDLLHDQHKRALAESVRASAALQLPALSVSCWTGIEACSPAC